MLNNLKLPQNILELSNITDKEYPAEKWSGAVNLLLVENEVVLIKRSDTMPTHKGQIGFMGGHKDAEESEPIVTAVREFCEESGFDSGKIKCLGLIHPVWTSQRKVIIPVLTQFLGTKKEFLDGVKSNGEWDDLVLAPFKFLYNENHWVRGNIQSGGSFSFYFVPLLLSECTYLNKSIMEPYVLWGATAKMVLNFFQKHMDDDRSSL
jgi:8-oxo-dGTP pyrophosphatase MutT (NUDIX family)